MLSRKASGILLVLVNPKIDVSLLFVMFNDHPRKISSIPSELETKINKLTLINGGICVTD